MTNVPKHEKIFVVLPSFGYWEIDGKPVSSREAFTNYSKAKWMPSDLVLHPERYQHC